MIVRSDGTADHAGSGGIDGGKHHEQVAAPLLPDRTRRRIRRDHHLAMLLGDVGDGLGDRRPVRAEHRIDLVLDDQLLVEAGSGLAVGFVVVDDELDRASEDSGFRIHVLLAEQVALTPVSTLHRILRAGQGHRGADPKRLLREARPRQANCERNDPSGEREQLRFHLADFARTRVALQRRSASAGPRDGRRRIGACTLAMCQGRACRVKKDSVSARRRAAPRPCSGLRLASSGW